MILGYLDLERGRIIGKLNIEYSINNWDWLPYIKVQNIEDDVIAHQKTYIKRCL